MSINDIINSGKSPGEMLSKKYNDSNNVINLEEKLKEKRQELKENSKELCDLVKTEYFIVESAVCESFETCFTPEARLGGKSPSYEGGYKTIFDIKVRPERGIPIKKLQFMGYCHVEKGDYIFAKIPCYKEQKLPRIKEPARPTIGQEEEAFYLDREFKQKENAIEVGVVLRNGQIKDEIYRSIDYRDFMD